MKPKERETRTDMEEVDKVRDEQIAQLRNKLISLKFIDKY